MIRVMGKGNARKTLSFLDRLRNQEIYKDMNRYGEMGVAALSAATPRRSGETANSWTYGVERSGNRVTLYWDNTNQVRSEKIAILIQYGHGTGTGGYVPSTDYINPALKPVFDQIANEVWKKVTSG